VKPPRHASPRRGGKTLNAKLDREARRGELEKIPSAPSPGGPAHRHAHRDTESGEVLVQTNTEINSQMLSQIMGRGWHVQIALIIQGKNDQSMYETLARDHFKSPDEALVEIYRRASGRAIRHRGSAAPCSGHVHGPAALRPGACRAVHDQTESCRSTRRSPSRRCAARTSWR